ncbi:hypothetical protein N7457_003831 [Penicillium paradoxum]|uniref:uncharacterized protein n=1 Tax=Penicillium paradoxum TaxID=176176 RepID=UPI00254704BE|nr:uncharacterized protein N7457_003831 [Penicillium paradoxum]KAJ5782057.1 hypothetical protein N7457_003831 [Penicillium paradoxum]
MPGSSTASSSSIGSSPPPMARTGTRPGERPEGHDTVQPSNYSGQDGSGARARAFPVRPGSERKRRLTTTSEDASSQRGRVGGTAGPALDNRGTSRSVLPHRSVSMVLPSSRTRTSVSMTPGSSIATAIDLSSSPPVSPRLSSGEQALRTSRRENPTSWNNQTRSVSSLSHTPPSTFMDMLLPKWQADSEYIVRPPEFVDLADSSPMPSSRAPQIVDLTGDNPSSSFPSIVNPALGGGEEVRLCNPCVPDPNPNPLGYTTMRSHGHRPTHSLSSTMNNPYHASSGQTQNPEARQERRTVGTNDRPQFLDALNSPPRQVPSASNIPRQRRSLSNRDGGPSRRHAPDEADFCPVCRRQFPPLSSGHPLEARQSHIRDCIEGYLRPPAPSRTSLAQQETPLPHPPPTARMLPFVATEKDCLGEDGQAAECTICMEDYEVGQTLARLECLCKFHKHCIVDWFERKMECPVHKLS